MYITMADTRFNNFRNLKSTFYPDQKQVKAYLKTGKVVRKNCNGPWKDYSTKKALQKQQLFSVAYGRSTTAPSNASATV